MEEAFLKEIKDDASDKISILNQNISNLEVVKLLFGF